MLIKNIRIRSATMQDIKSQLKDEAHWANFTWVQENTNRACHLFILSITMGTSDYTVYHSETVISQSQEGSIFIFRFTAPHGRARNTELRFDSPSICKPNFWKSYRWKLGNQGEQKSPKFWQHREQIMCVQTGTWKKHMKSMSVINLSV